jgi:hypothetical protein
LYEFQPSPVEEQVGETIGLKCCQGNLRFSMGYAQLGQIVQCRVGSS